MHLGMKADSKRAPGGALSFLVPASRLELLRLVATTPSRWRVYQFHHAGNVEGQVSLKAQMRSMTGFAELLLGGSRSGGDRGWLRGRDWNHRRGGHGLVDGLVQHRAILT